MGANVDYNDSIRPHWKWSLRFSRN